MQRGMDQHAFWRHPHVVKVPTQYEKLGDCTQQNNMLTIIGGGDSESDAHDCEQASRLTHVFAGSGAS